jgi:hypothetical protein
MDFRQTSQPSSGRPAVVTPAPSAPERKEEKSTSSKKLSPNKLMRLVYLVLLVGIAVLLLCIALGIGHSNSSNNEAQYVQSSKYQAVFLNNGQVYFGNIKDLNSQYLRMSNIYYLTQSGDSSSNYSLVKLGCQQIHDPLDQMVINRSQVTFWENLDNSGKVVKSIAQFKQQNPNGPDCSQVSAQTQASPSSSQSSQNSSTTGTGTNSTTTGTGTTDTTKK